jgi:hypothetical protein
MNSHNKPVACDRPTIDYTCSYHHDGCEWSITISAYDWMDAEARVKKLGWLKLDGEIVATYPAYMGWWAKLTVAIRNFLWTTR